MKNIENRQIRLKRVPSGVPELKDFELSRCHMEEPLEGYFLAKTLILSLDPYIRAVMSGRHFYGVPAVGDIVRARSVARVEVSRNKSYREGDLVLLETGLQDYIISDGHGVHAVDTGSAPISAALGVMGMPGLTAYAALFGPAQMQAGETILVSAASGAVGCMVGQIAKLNGCLAYGIAGSKQKCDWVVNEAGFDGCFDRKLDNIDMRLAENLSDGANIFFDNTGGDLQEIVLTRHLADNSRIILSGLISQYNSVSPPPGPNLGNLVKVRATVFGFVVYDFEHMREKFLTDVKGWYDSGDIAFNEDVTVGLETAPSQFIKLMRGENFGKTLVDTQSEE
ncbi:MAG: NADP-dependent oxidoreductase [Rhodospirillaceae bacterium]|nr:NADP-dependent oxidoreductase [Rhodospirillaceae bacterium]